MPDSPSAHRLLHGSDSTPFGRRVRIVLAELGLPFERDITPTTGREHAQMARLNPALQVPVLEDGGTVVYDSRVVVDYLLGKYPLPAGGQPPLRPHAISPMRHLEESLPQSSLETLTEAAVTIRQMEVSGVAREQSGYLQRHDARIIHILDWLEGRVRGDGFDPGLLTVADITLICALDFLEFYQLTEWRGRPGLERIHGAHRDRPSIRSTHPGANA